MNDLLGTIPQWIAALSTTGALGLLVKLWLGNRKLSIEDKKVDNENAADIRDHLAEEMAALRTNIAALRQELNDCEENCDRRLGIAEARIRALDEELWGEKKQRVAEQISLINVILNTVDAPELKTLLKTLESVRTHLFKEASK